MVGRDVERAFADILVAEVAAGLPRALAVRGEPGIGKTLLLEHLTATAEAAGFLVRTDRAPGDQARLFGVPVGAAAGRHRRHEVVSRLLAGLPEGAPLLLVLDDAHRAGPATVEMISHLLRHPPGARVLLGLALRPRYAPPALLRTLHAAQRCGSLDTVELGPLPAEDAEALLGAAVAGPDRARAIAESGGNPFYLQQLARAPGDGTGAPPAIVASLREELCDLPAAAALLLSAAAVVGNPFDAESAAAGVPLPEGEALDLLDELCRRDVVHGTEVPRRFAFRHPVLRRAARAAARPGARGGVPVHPVPARRTRARTTAERRPHRGPDAVRLLTHALAALPDPLSATASRLRLAIATVHLWDADHEEASRWAGRARVAARDPVLRGVAAALLAGAAGRAGTVAETRTAADEASALLDPLPDDVIAAHVDAVALLGWSETTIERPGPACAHLRRALTLAGRTGQAYLLPEVHAGLAVALTWIGALAAAARAGDEAVACAHSTRMVDSRVRALGSRCATAVVAGDLAVATRLGEQTRGLAGATPEVTATAAEVRLAAGDHEAGIAALQDAGCGPDLPRIVRSRRPYWFALLTEAEIRAGRRADATGWAERAEQAAAGLGLAGRTGWALRAAAAVRNAHREHATAAGMALRSAELLERAGNPVEAARSRTLAGVALGAAGQRSRAAAELTAAADVLAGCGATGLGAQAAALLRGIRCAGSGAGNTARDVLSPREHQIAQLVASGRTNREIAEELMLSVKTVETHLGRAFAKLGVPTRSALAAQVRTGM